MPPSPLKLRQARALDPRFYTSHAIYDYELKTLIPSGWQVIAPSELVSDRGDVIARKLGDIPIIVTRNTKGELKGFYNICPHRAGPCLLYTSPSPRDATLSRMPSSA